MALFLKVIPALIFWGIFVFVVLRIPYPDSLTQANSLQIFPFFVSLYLALVFSLNIFLKNILFSSSICLGLICLLILKALDSLNIVTGILTAVATYLLASYFLKGNSPTVYFKKAKKRNLNPIKSDLTKQTKIPKLTKLL